MTEKFIRCKGCGRGARTLQFYDAANDELFHDQECADAANGIIRGPDGMVIDMTEQYKCKQKFKDEENDR